MLKTLAVTASAAAAISLCISAGSAAQLRSTRPQIALQYAPFDAQAKAELAESRLPDLARNTSLQAEIEHLTRAALVRDPTLASAWRSLAILSELRGEKEKAKQLFHYTQRLSRRDLPTQFWFIEQEVAADDIPGALHHYDIALRTSPESGRILLPVLVAATSEDAIIGPLAKLLLTNPPWKSDLIGRFTESIPSAKNLARLFEEIASQQPLPRDPVISTIINRLVSEREFAAAWRIHRLLRRPSQADLLLRDEGFEVSEPLSPFDWNFESEAHKGAQPIFIYGAGEGSVLEARASSGLGGMVARQLLLLPPGDYQLSALIGPIPASTAAQLYWKMTCVEEQSRDILATGPHTANKRLRIQADFQVPRTNCPAQWLSLDIRAQDESSSAVAWVDSVQVRELL